MDIQILPTSQEDLGELAVIYKTAYNSLNIGENWDDESAEALLKHFLNQQPDLFFTARDGNKIVGGIVALVKPWWDGNHLTDGEIFVDVNAQGKGIGTKLIKMLFTEAQNQYKAVSWDTFTHRVYEYPLAWYKSMGFEEIKYWVMIGGNIKDVLKNLESK